MAKLYFRYGTVGSAKTLNLLAVAHNYERQGKPVVVMKPAVDTRFGTSKVASRAGLNREADLLLEADTEVPPSLRSVRPSCAGSSPAIRSQYAWPSLSSPGRSVRMTTPSRSSAA